MAAAYRYVMEQRAAEFTLALAEDEQELVRSFFRWLAANPDRTGDANHRDSGGRLNQAHLCGPFTIVFGPITPSARFAWSRY